MCQVNINSFKSIKGPTDEANYNLNYFYQYRARRPSYGDAAVGEVQLHRIGRKCTVKAKICPEHKIHNKAYAVTVVIDETEDNEVIDIAKCHDCVASKGGCKHAVAVVAWLHRRSEEPACTDVDCYWKKNALSQVGASVRGITLEALFGSTIGSSETTATSGNGNNVQHDDDFLSTIIQQGVASGSKAQLILDSQPCSTTYYLSLFHLSRSFVDNRKDADKFINHCTNEMEAAAITKAEQETRLQCESLLWFELRFARITASIIYDVAHCKTPDGSLVERIMGSRSPDTPAMKRGRELESQVLKNVQTRIGCHISKCGLILRKDYPIFGATPDGITKTHVIEVKCPQKDSKFSNYYSNGQIKNKYKAQIQLQMFFANRNKAFFCIAHADFETSKLVKIVEESFDVKILTPLIQKSTAFWKLYIYPKLTW